jgi:hypothetical protein
LPCSASLRVSAGRQLPEAKKPWRKIIFFMLAYFVIDFYLGDKDTIFGAFIQLFLKDAGHFETCSKMTSLQRISTPLHSISYGKALSSRYLKLIYGPFKRSKLVYT